jgi:hypothetical protein
MAKSQPKPLAQPRPGAKIQSIPKSPWQGPLVAGLGFALGYGITQRLLSMQLPTFVNLGQGFELRAFPGTALQSLRLKFGTEAQSIRGDLELQQLEQQSKAAETSGEPSSAPLDGAEPGSQSEPNSANLEGLDGLAPPAPQNRAMPVPSFELGNTGGSPGPTAMPCWGH